MRIQPVENQITAMTKFALQTQPTCASPSRYPKERLRIVSSSSPTEKAKLRPSPKQR
ncbi:hypothetical protein CBM2626_B140176 [Cupriavidus taiwanensis]|nr:hypothetical protein CBM2626_B140176 [Cupriavidus taiwanensis]